MTDDLIFYPWRTGRSVHRTLYACPPGSSPRNGEVLIGMMDTQELAEHVVRKHNAAMLPAARWTTVSVESQEMVYALIAVAKAARRYMVAKAEWDQPIPDAAEGYPVKDPIDDENALRNALDHPAVQEALRDESSTSQGGHGLRSGGAGRPATEATRTRSHDDDAEPE